MGSVHLMCNGIIPLPLRMKQKRQGATDMQPVCLESSAMGEIGQLHAESF